MTARKAGNFVCVYTVEIIMDAINIKKVSSLSSNQYFVRGKMIVKRRPSIVIWWSFSSLQKDGTISCSSKNMKKRNYIFSKHTYCVSLPVNLERRTFAFFKKLSTWRVRNRFWSLRWWRRRRRLNIFIHRHSISFKFHFVLSNLFQQGNIQKNYLKARCTFPLKCPFAAFKCARK